MSIKEHKRTINRRNFQTRKHRDRIRHYICYIITIYHLLQSGMADFLNGTCFICFKSMSSNKTYINCGHAFCDNCIKLRAASLKTCPRCMKKFDQMSSTKPDEETCVICQETPEGRKGFLQCMHSFCLGCIQEWMKHSRKCPICKTTSTTILPVKPTNPPARKPPNDFLSFLQPRRSPSPTLLSEIPLEVGVVPSKRMFGHFRCVCGKYWKSGHSFEGVKQDCGRCARAVLPYQLDPLQFTGFGIGKGPHLTDLCGMCKKLGRDCSKMPSYSQEPDVDLLLPLFNDFNF